MAHGPTHLLAPLFGVILHCALPAQAYCALRDPMSAIRELYPDATSHRSILRTVGNAARRAVASQLPFRMHFNELGRHTLYVVLDGRTPIGLVHVRSEKGYWGLTELAWALDLNLNVLDFQFQRCRDQGRSLLEKEAFREQLRGKGFGELKSMLSSDGGRIESTQLNVPAGAEDLAATLLRCGLKTNLITEAVWGSTIEELKLQSQAFRDFPAARSIEAVQTPFSDEVTSALRVKGLELFWACNKESAAAARVLDEHGNAIGMVVCSVIESNGDRFASLWSVSSSYEVVAIRPENGWPDRETENVFVELQGKVLHDSSNCMSAAELVCDGVLTLCQVHLSAK